MQTVIYSVQGKKAGTVELPENVFGVPFNADLVHQVLVSMESNQRAGTAHTKNRGEVEGSRAKPWKQKGTGRARHGDKRSPIWKGGGVTHGPRNERNYKKAIPVAMKKGALMSVLSEKFRQEKMLFVEKLALADSKTKDAASILKQLATVDGAKNITRKDARVCLVVKDAPRTLVNSFRNLPQVSLVSARQVSAQDIAIARYVIVTDAQEAVNAVVERVNK